MKARDFRLVFKATVHFQLFFFPKMAFSIRKHISKFFISAKLKCIYKPDAKAINIIIFTFMNQVFASLF